MKKPRKFAEGGWSTSTSFDEADAKRRAEEWAKSHAKKPATKPAAKSAAPAPKATPKTTPKADDIDSGMDKFIAGFRNSQKPKARPAGPKPGSSEYVDRQVADSRAEKAAVEKGKKSAFAGAQMMEPDAAKQARKAYIYEPAAAIATMPLAEGAAAARAARAADSHGFIGKAGKAALDSLKKRGQLARNTQKYQAGRKQAVAAKKAAKGEWTEEYGLGLRKGGRVKKYAGGGRIDGCAVRGKTKGTNR